MDTNKQAGMPSDEQIEKWVMSQTGCTEGNHAHDCQCSAMEESAKWVRDNFMSPPPKSEAEVEEEIRKLKAFKDYVHQRLDEAGIEKEPNGEHSKHGCRIGDRLDIALSAPSKPKDEVEEEVYVWDGINGTLEEVADVEHATKFIKENFIDDTDGIHPDIESVFVVKKIAFVHVEDTDKKSEIHGEVVPVCKVTVNPCKKSDPSKGKYSEWISVEDRLPVINTDVIVYTKRDFVNSSTRIIGWFDGKYWNSTSMNEDEDIFVTHWMPLPEAPESSNTNPNKKANP